MPFEYRLTFHLLKEDRIATPKSQLHLPVIGTNLRLQGGRLDAPINESPRLVLVGGPFENQSAAAEGGKRARRAILLWALQRRLALDLGDSRRRGEMTEEGVAYFSRLAGGPVRDQLHGLDVYEQQENQRFISFKVQAALNMDVESTVSTIASWYNTNPELTDKQELAAELYCSAHFDGAYRSRFLTLMTALEALLDYQPRSAEVTTVVKLLEATVKASQLDGSEKQSLLGSLQWLHQESIGQAGRRFAATLLPNQIYRGMEAAKYFGNCYNLRSTIVHSGYVPEHIDLLEISNELHRFVGDLLQASLAMPST